ncbi:MAG: hypothetical protein R3345_15245 [Fulvivirga sp.]|nr:hypothetical protein [Fulvivirga sp.]
MTHEDVIQTQKLIIKDLGLSQEELPATVEDLETLKKRLIPLINFLLNKDLNRLLTAFYRIDLDEKKVKYVLTQENPEAIAGKLADMVITRELQKVITRKKYR